MSPVLAALLFHGPGVRLFAKRRLSPLAVRLNLAAVAVTGLAMVLAGARAGPPAVLGAWALGHSLWSVTLAVLVHRGSGLLHDAGDERDGPRAA
jgi:hypothetical protein